MTYFNTIKTQMRKFATLLIAATVAVSAFAQDRFLGGDSEGREAMNPKKQVDFGASMLQDLITSYQTPLLTPTQVGGKWTIGYSFTDKVNKKFPNITVQNATDMLGKELDAANIKKNQKVGCVLERIEWEEPKVNKKTNTTIFTQNNLNPYQYSALISFVYDVGCPQFLKIAPQIKKVLKNQTANINDSIQSIIGSIGNSTNRAVEIGQFTHQ